MYASRSDRAGSRGDRNACRGTEPNAGGQDDLCKQRQFRRLVEIFITNQVCIRIWPYKQTYVNIDAAGPKRC